VEFITDPTDFERFTVVLDETLRSINSDYDAKRTNNMILTLPLITKLAPGGFDNWLKLQGKLGGQNKIPRLANDRKIMEQLLEVNGINANS